MTEGFLGLGSNVGDRRAQLAAAVAALPAHGVAVRATSSVYETEPVGELLDQRAFLNAVARIATDLDPEGLLDAVKAVERERGRTPGGVRHGPREVDVDVLLLGGREHRSRRLTLPHEQILTRRFVLVPLLELEPGLALPDGTRLAPVAEALADAPGQAVARHSGSLPVP